MDFGLIRGRPEGVLRLVAEVEEPSTFVVGTSSLEVARQSIHSSPSKAASQVVGVVNMRPEQAGHMPQAKEVLPAAVEFAIDPGVVIEEDMPV